MFGGHCGRTHGVWSDGYGSAPPPTVQSVVEGQLHVEDAAIRTRGLILDGLHYWNILHIVTGRGRPGHATPLGQLYGPGLYEGGAVEGDYGLPT